MIVFINNQEVNVADGATVAEVLQQQSIPTAGIAVAVDNRVVSRALWTTTVVNPGNRLTVIQAVCGG